MSTRILTLGLVTMTLVLIGSLFSSAPAAEDTDDQPALSRDILDFPLLFTKRKNIQGIHIYDTYYKWFPGGGIYVLENPSDPPEKHRIRAIIDPTTKETLGEGMYWQPELSYDAKRVLFCHKGSPAGSTSIYEIGIDGTGLKRLTDPGHCEREYHGRGGGVHDFGPNYLPDGKIVFTSNRYSSLIPCANEGSDILHVMNADGTDIHAISVNVETEFDPTVMEDGRILYGRWEYIDKTALTVQSLWTVYPDGTNETATYANNMVFPEAILDPRQVPGEQYLVVGSFTPHNAPPRGTVAMIDTSMDKNDPDAIFNFDTPDRPTNDRGNSCDPYPLSKNTILYSGMNGKFNAIMMVNRKGERVVVYADPEIDCHAPIPVRPRLIPKLRNNTVDRTKRTGTFFVQDVYEGMPEVPRGEVKWLRVVEDTSRTSPTPGGSPVNQTFLVSAALSFTIKDYMGVVPVEPDGSIHFECPAGRAVFFQALDADGRCIRAMRTFIQAAPGTTRACIGCHENKRATFPPKTTPPMAFRRPASQLQDESWGSGPIVYTEQIQPIFDRHCVSCHGGEKGMARGLDLSGGWTELFNISYEHLSNRREVQYKAPMIGGIDCMNGTSYYSSKILPAYTHYSGFCPLSDVLVKGALGHDNRFDMPRAERDLILAWIDSNGQYNGTWDYVSTGFYGAGWKETKQKLMTEMQQAGCMECHVAKNFENDWFNLKDPKFSRILRAPLPKGKEGHGLGLCRARKADASFDRLRMMTSGGYQHAVKPLEWFPAQKWKEWDESGEPHVSFASAADETYQKMLGIIEQGRTTTLSKPRVDMPGANIIAGTWRRIVPVILPEDLPELHATIVGDGVVNLAWTRNTHTWGLGFELHRSESPDFTPSAETLIEDTRLFRTTDKDAAPGKAYYALIAYDETDRSKPIRATIDVPQPKPPATPAAPQAAGRFEEIVITWPAGELGSTYHVYRTGEGETQAKRITESPVQGTSMLDVDITADRAYRYSITAVSARGSESERTAEVSAAAKPLPREAVFVASLKNDANGQMLGGGTVAGKTHGAAKIADGALDTTAGGHITYAPRDDRLFDLRPKFTMLCRVRFETATDMPVIISHGLWQKGGWFLQELGGRWRWHVGGISCDGGTVEAGRWYSVACVLAGSKARLYVDGKLLAETSGSVNLAPWTGPLMVGQYSGGTAASYQVSGQVQDVKIFQRALTPEEIAQEAK